MFTVSIIALFFTAAGTNARTEVVARTEARTRGGGNTWFNLARVEHPWQLGLYAGYTNNTLYQGGAEHSRPGKIWESRSGWTGGIPVRFQIFNWLAVQAETVFITKNYSYYYHSYANRPYNETTNSFVEFPLLVNLSMRPAGEGGAARVRLYINVGGFLGVWAASRETGSSLSIASTTTAHKYNEYYEFDDRRDNRFEYGLAAGLGVQYEIGIPSVFVEWRYNYGLSDLQKPYQYNLPPQMNNTWTIQLGIFFNPGKIGVKK
jgi:hypothetical protein